MDLVHPHKAHIKECSERVSDLPEVTQQGSGRNRLELSRLALGPRGPDSRSCLAAAAVDRQSLQSSLQPKGHRDRNPWGRSIFSLPDALHPCNPHPNPVSGEHPPISQMNKLRLRGGWDQPRVEPRVRGRVGVGVRDSDLGARVFFCALWDRQWMVLSRAHGG